MSESTTRKEIDPSLPHYEVRLLLSQHEPGRAFDAKFSEFAAVPRGPAYSTDLNAVVRAISKTGWWWRISHNQAVVIPTCPAPGLEGFVSNASIYDREGRPIEYHALVMSDGAAMALCEAWLMAAYDLPPAFFVEASARAIAMARHVPTRKEMMAYYRAREDARQETIREMAALAS